MGLLDEAIDIKNLGQSNLWVIYGKSTSGKTTLAATFPKPLLYLQIGDDGSNSISDVEGVKALRIQDLDQFKKVLVELQKDTTYATIVVDTFSMVVNEWLYTNAVQKNKKVTQNMWGEIMTDTNEYVKMLHILAKNKYIVMTCHEVTDSFEGLENEISPEIRPNVSKGARTYLEGMANYGIHTTVFVKDKEMSDGTVQANTFHAIHLAPNPYYWVKTQKPSNIKLPKVLLNPTFEKIKNLLKGEIKNG